VSGEEGKKKESANSSYASGWEPLLWSHLKGSQRTSSTHRYSPRKHVSCPFLGGMDHAGGGALARDLATCEGGAGGGGIRQALKEATLACAKRILARRAHAGAFPARPPFSPTDITSARSSSMELSAALQQELM
jgi:hypothetical protein